MAAAARIKQIAQRTPAQLLLAGSIAGLGLLALLLSLSWLPPLARAQAPVPNDNTYLAACPSGPSFSFDPTNPDPGETVTFQGSVTATGGGGPVTFTWRMGDGSSPLTATPNLDYAYNSNGVFTIQMTATGESCGSPPSTSRMITVGFGTPAMVLYFPIMVNTSTDLIPTGATPRPMPPAPVIGLTGRFFSPGNVTLLRWQPAAVLQAVTGYAVYRGAASQAAPFSRLATLPVHQNSFIDVGNSCGHGYYITALNAAGESPAGQTAFFTPDCR